MTVAPSEIIDGTQKAQELPPLKSDSRRFALESTLKAQRMNAHFTNDMALSQPQGGHSFQDWLQQPVEQERLSLPLTAPVQDASLTHHQSFEKISLKMPEMPVGEFVKTLWSKASQAASLIGLDPKLLIAQAALETGWGRFIIKNADGSSSNNLFNIKSTSQEGVVVTTTEYEASRAIKTQSAFKTYDSIEASFKDYISLITQNKRYENALACTQKPEQYIKELHKAGYATDPQYSNKIMHIYYSKELNQALAEYKLSV